MTTVKQIRPQQIVIDQTGKNTANWLQITLQRVIRDSVSYAVVQRDDRIGFVHREQQAIAAELFTFRDPVQNKNITVSGAGLYRLLEVMANTWIIADRGGALNAQKDVIEP